MDGRLEALDSNGDSLETAQVEAVARRVLDEVGVGDTFKKTFAALAREVKALKEDEHKREGGPLTEILSSTEFKEAFDAKINQVLGYLKNEVVPNAVKKAFEGN